MDGFSTPDDEKDEEDEEDKKMSNLLSKKTDREH